VKQKKSQPASKAVKERLSTSTEKSSLPIRSIIKAPEEQVSLRPSRQLLTPTNEGGDNFQLKGLFKNPPGRCSDQGRGSERRGSNMSILREYVDEDIRRGVAAGVVLAWFGVSFRSDHGSMTAKHTDFSLSAQVRKIDDFISHDWKSGRWPKFIALCYLYNSRAAVIASTITFIVLTLVQVHVLSSGQTWRNLLLFEGRDPFPFEPDKDDAVEKFTGGFHRFDAKVEKGYLCNCVCPIVFTFFFVFWQGIRGALRLTERFLFVDKFCVDQLDADRKQRAIKSFAGFLQLSHHFVICWTPDYFTRLWCTYEVASWLHLGKSVDDVIFVALSQALLDLTLLMAIVSVFIITAFSWNQSDVVYFGIVVIDLIFFLFPMMHVGRRVRHDWKVLPQALKKFKVRDTRCYCCNSCVGHVHPDSGEKVRCDRRQVYKTLASWFAPTSSCLHQPSVACGPSPTSTATDVNLYDMTTSSTGMTPNHLGGTESTALHAEEIEQGLNEFDKRVRETFGTQVLQRAGPGGVVYWHGFIAGLPAMWRYGDRFAGLLAVKSDWAIYLMFYYAVLTGAIIPLTYKGSAWIMQFLESVAGLQDNLYLDTLFSMGAACALIMFWGCLYLPIEILYRFSHHTWCFAGFFIVAFAEIGLIFVFFPGTAANVPRIFHFLFSTDGVRLGRMASRDRVGVRASATE
jgi:hypothetical protein